jgi:EGF-like domain
VGTGLDLEEQDEGRFITLQPRDGSANELGSFPCGRDVGYEGKEFRLPKNFTCDKCTLQFEWDLGEGRQIHQCADFLMSNKDIEECSGKCLNGGVCVNGECVCRTSFYGDLCQNKSKKHYVPDNDYRSGKFDINGLHLGVHTFNPHYWRPLLLQRQIIITN